MSKGKKRKKTDQEKHADMLYYEYTLYNGYLREHGGVPKAILPGKWSQELLDALSKLPVPHGGYGDDQNLRFLIMSRLGPDVDAARAKTGPWPLPRQAGYGRQMLSLLRTLHERCKMVFVDVKPENFMFGLPGTVHEDKIFLIDFGLSERYTGPGGAIKPQKTSSQVAGTPEFLSLRCHAGAGAGRCDDLESLGYVIIAMMRGGSSPLPWSGTTSVAEGLKNKRATTLEDVCRGIPGPMLRYMNLVRGMAYEDTPEYDALDSLLQEIETSGEVSAMPPVPSRTRDGSGDQRRGAVGSNDESDAIRQVNPKGRGKGKGSTKTTTSAAAAQRPEHADESMRTRPRRGEAAKSGGKGIEEAGAASTEDVAEVIEVSDVMGEAAGKGRSVGSRRRAAKGAAASPKTRKTRDGAGLAAARDTTSLVSPPLEDSANFSSDQRKARSSSRRGTGAKEDTGSSASGSHGSRVKRRAAPRKRVRDGDESDRDGDGGGSSSNREEDGGGEEVDEVAGDGGAGQSGDDTDGFFDAREQIKDGEKDGAEVGLVDGGGCATGRGNREARRAARNTRKSEIEAAVATESRSKKGRSDSKESHKYRLEVLTGPHKGDSLLIPATGTEVRVGRGAPRRNGLRLDRDMEVSDRHSVLRVSADWVMCEDVGSLNGTFVNEDKLEGPSKVVAGDVLQFGQSAVRICVV